MYVKKSLVGI